MIEFPEIPEEPGLPTRPMRLAEYARFSELCLRSNRAITPANCLVRRSREKTMERPFGLGAPDEAKAAS